MGFFVAAGDCHTAWHDTHHIAVIDKAVRRVCDAVRMMLATVLCCAMIVSLTACSQFGSEYTDNVSNSQTIDSAVGTVTSPTLRPNIHDDLVRIAVPAPIDVNLAHARHAVAAMSLEEQVGQLIMAPLFAGTDPSTMHDVIAGQHIGSVLIIGNWTGGVASVRAATDMLQSYTPTQHRLLIATDQEGGLVQHLKGPGFDRIPSAVVQGTMTPDALRASAKVWGNQLATAGIGIDLAPVAGTVTVDRASNAPIGALNRDFGLDANGNADHAIAFVEGMRDSGVGASVKHYPGLGAVTGNTDFTTDGILDVTTTANGPEISVFTQVIHESKPAMVMMSLATYQQIDSTTPAVFSPTIINGLLRTETGYDGVVTSDSLSAAALGGIAPDQLGVRLIEAGGDLACIGDNSYVQPIIEGLLARARTDESFARRVRQSAERVMTLKFRMGLAS